VDISRVAERRLITKSFVLWPEMVIGLCPATLQSSGDSQLMLHSFQLRKRRSSSRGLAFCCCLSLEDLCTKVCQLFLQCSDPEYGIVCTLLLLSLHTSGFGHLLCMRLCIGELLPKHQDFFLLFPEVSQLLLKSSDLPLSNGSAVPFTLKCSLESKEPDHSILRNLRRALQCQQGQALPCHSWRRMWLLRN
jgi:hypothetical protein